MPTIPCPHCQHEIIATDPMPGSTIQCPSCGETVEVPAPAPVAPPAGPGGTVFAMGAVLLAGVVIVVVLFWGGLLKKRDVRPPKHDDKKQGIFLPGKQQTGRLAWKECSSQTNPQISPITQIHETSV